MNNAAALVFAIPFAILWNYFGLHAAIIISLLLVAALCAAFFYFHNERKDNQIDLLRTCIDQHVRELMLKHRQLTFSGDYGTMDMLNWRKEKKKFIDLVFAPGVGGRSAIIITDKDMHSMIDQAVAAANDSGSVPELIANDASGQEYEMLCTKLLNENVWDARMTALTGDQGADIVATKNGTKLVVQCKYYTGNVGNDAVQQVAAARIYYAADIAVVVSNAGYTKSARQLAKSLNVRLIHHDEIPSIEARVGSSST
ncbi:restriction endonuclease [Massilia scottii]|uniref:restriction endonuclease n=1 Tax=Massilia scottii TaxID=3057166 RepID=UPI0027968437|nr:restriction endonuclease [Massilia sp. CCM 9029]MDQ1832831.1 restriction endonuclease [Massilia sp. CCM 9029]